LNAWELGHDAAIASGLHDDFTDAQSIGTILENASRWTSPQRSQLYLQVHLRSGCNPPQIQA
jgi:hypothetical protein